MLILMTSIVGYQRPGPVVIKISIVDVLFLYNANFDDWPLAVMINQQIKVMKISIVDVFLQC